MNGQILRSLKETISFEHPTYIGGGTDIMPLLKNGVRDDCELVFLKKIPELRELTDAGSYLVIGSGMTLTELAENKLVNERCTVVAQAASLTASPQIRNIATIGGNIMQDAAAFILIKHTSGAAALPIASRPAAPSATRFPIHRCVAQFIILMLLQR